MEAMGREKNRILLWYYVTIIGCARLAWWRPLKPFAENLTSLFRHLALMRAACRKWDPRTGRPGGMINETVCICVLCSPCHGACQARMRAPDGS